MFKDTSTSIFFLLVYCNFIKRLTQDNKHMIMYNNELLKVYIRGMWIEYPYWINEKQHERRTMKAISLYHQHRQDFLTKL